MTESERNAVREQLERMLANPLFKHSKRYPTLLRYLVEHTLQGSPGELKERTLGVEVFGRRPDYDTNADPVVRTTAGEIRKRIAQYYHEPGHESELRIELQPGSYVPEFRPPAPGVPIRGVTEMAPGRRWKISYTVGALAPLVVAGAAIWYQMWTPKTALDRFWRPVLASSNNVLLCVGQ